jgi:hypothetical protein
MSDKNFVLDMFNGKIKNFVDFNEQPASFYIQPPGYKRITDEALLHILKTDFDLTPQQFAAESTFQKQKVVKTLLNKKATKKQISRLLGISESSLYHTKI